MKKLLASLTAAYLKWIPFRRGKKHIARKFGPLCERVPVTTTYGFPIYTRFQDNTNRLCFEGRSDRVIEFIQTLPEGAALLDIGANQGAMSILAARTVGAEGIVLAFEPSSDTVDRLRANQKLNAVKNLLVFPQAIGRRNEVLSFGSSDPLHSGAAHVGGGLEAIPSSPINEVSGLEQYLGERLIYAKIDTEGFELEVLHGLEQLLERQRIKALVIEINDEHLRRFDASSEALYKMLEGHGYQAETGLQPGHYDEIFRLKDKDSG